LCWENSDSGSHYQFDQLGKNMKLPDDVVRWVSSHFSETDQEQALVQLRSAAIHTGEPASPRLLRCVVVSSAGGLARLGQQIKQLHVDWRDVIMAGEYKFQEGRNIRIHDFNGPIEDS
jgi:hypothetical protein